jgi:hypothetical protein
MEVQSLFDTSSPHPSYVVSFSFIVVLLIGQFLRKKNYVSQAIYTQICFIYTLLYVVKHFTNNFIAIIITIAKHSH